MSTPINNGGPAFPVVKSTGFLTSSTTQIVSIGGMTLRDWFAGQAMMGMLSSKPLTFCAADAYVMADAMLAARKEKP